MIRSHTSTQVKNQDQVDKFIKELERAPNAYVSIGIHEGAGEYPNGVSVVEVGLWNEFGTRTSPERSWMRATIDENESKLNAWRDELIGKIMFEGWTIEKALEAMGFRIQVLLQNKIKSNVPPANAPSTIKHKEREGVAPVTLMDTKLLLRSITYQVHLK